MANKRWLGRAGAVAQVDTVTITTGSGWAGSDTVTLTINGKDLVVTLGTLLTNAEIATTIRQAWENLTFADTTATKIPADGGQDFAEHAEITATVSGSVVTLTHDTDGTPFTLTAAPSGTGIVTVATATTATGPNHWDNDDNWDPTNAPTAADDVFIDNSDVSILYGLANTGNTLTSMTIGQNFTGTIGLPKRNGGGYVEYRTEYLEIEMTTLTVGLGDGSGSGRIKINAGSVQSAVSVEKTGSSEEFGVESFLWKGTHVNNTLEVNDGSVGVAVFDSETAVIATLLVAAGSVRCGAGTTLTTITNRAGLVDIRSNVSGTFTTADGTVTVSGSATVETLTINGGTVVYKSSGTIMTANIGGTRGGLLDLSADNSARTISTLNLRAGGVIRDPLQTGIYTIALGSDVELVAAS